MERLTNRNKDGGAYFKQCFEEPCCGYGCKNADCPYIERVCKQLAAYEDTGISPEEVERMKHAYFEAVVELDKLKKELGDRDERKIM